MNISRLLPLLMLIPALTMADEDRNFKLTPENFKVGNVLDRATDLPIVLEGKVAISQEPVFPLKANQLYLRRKISGKEYLWFSGSLKAEDYKNLHAFNLKENRLSVREVVGLRLYASRLYKAFQDEADIYFDTEYVYSTRVPKLMFMKNGKWQVLKESPHPGIVEIQSDEKDLDVISYNSSLKNTSRLFYPVKEGLYVFGFNAPDKLPYVDIGRLKAGERLVFDVKFPVLDANNTTQLKLSVSEEQVRPLKTLEETEALYDSYSAEVDKNVLRIDTTEFSNLYPAPKSADSLGIAKTSSDYRNYINRYNLKRDESRSLWRSQKLGEVNLVYKALHAKLDSLQALPAQVNVIPTAVEVIRNPNDTTLVDSLKLRFGADNDRINVTWKGIVEGLSMDSLAKELTLKESSVITTIYLVNNKPVWVFKEGTLVGRYHYRYDKLAFRKGDALYFAKGEFTLPKHVAVEAEVRDWLRTKNDPTISAKVDPSAAKDAQKSDSTSKMMDHSTRGSVAVVDSGSFRYRGKVVSMSPFAIHTTEVTQDFFRKTMDALDSAKRLEDRSLFKGAQKPVQNITWEHAQYFCKTLGGDLPTEAQWEYAGRAGSNDGVLWKSDDLISVNKYAIFAENSLKVRKKDSTAYGPHDVATKMPNAWGLYDMSGNVAEWTRDNYFAVTFKIEDSNPTGSYLGTDKVLKGGSWRSKVKDLNMTNRDDEDPRYWSDWIGFRCVFPLQRIIQDSDK